MDLVILCRAIGLPAAVQLQVRDRLPVCEREEIVPLIQRLTDWNTAAAAYAGLREILGEDDMAMLTCQLRAAVLAYTGYQALGISEKVYVDTMACFTRFLEETRYMTGEYRYDRAYWSYRQVSISLFRIGQLEFELRRDRGSIAVHIPSDAVLSDSEVDASVRQAGEFLKEHFPECVSFPFTCHSWLLSPELGKLLPESSNIRRFQQRFRILEVQPEDRSFMQWLFAAPSGTPIEELPEDTSLRRNVKQLLLSGGMIGSALGVLI